MNQNNQQSSEEIQIDIEAAVGPEVPEGPDPAEAEGVHLVKLGQPGRGLRVFMSYPCLKQMLAHAGRRLDCEVGGILLGRICRSRLGLATMMAEALPAARTDAARGHVTFSHDSWEEIYSYLDSLGENLHIVGWYHTHPGFGVFFSDQDTFIQQNFFSGAGQLGVVVDPVKKQVAAFCCQEEELEPVAGLWINTTEETYGIAQRLVETLDYCGPRPGSSGWLQALAQPVHRLLRGEG